MADVSQPAGAYWAADGYAVGARLSLPLMPVMAIFGMAFGAVAAQKGLTGVEATLMSALMFAGASQFVAIELWADHMSWAGIVTLVLITATVNMRFVLMSAAMRPWLGGLPPWQTYPALAVMTDPGWLIALRYRSEGGANAAAFFASGFVLWLVWIASTTVGYYLGTLVSDPKTLGLDLVLPAFFIVMLVPLWSGARRAVSWAVGGAVALLASALMAGWWFIILGAIAGSIAAGFLDERD
ncbi:MAG: AzlC family ABC transporter permease [Burkholderiales bacterium]